MMTSMAEAKPRRGVWVKFLVVGFLCVSMAHAGVVAVPGSITFSRMEDSARIQLMEGDKPLPAQSVRGTQIVIGKNTYDHQFIVERAKSGPAVLTVRPNPATCEVGTFTLVVSTSAGSVLVDIATPLDQLPGMLENRAKERGIPLDQLKMELGLKTPAGRERVSVSLPDYFYEGYELHLPMTASPGRTYTWRIDGQTILEGPGKNELRHVFSKTGPRKIEFLESENGDVVASWSGTLNVDPIPPIELPVKKGASGTLAGPEGFTKYTWRMNGQVISNEPTLTYRVVTPVPQEIEVLAERPKSGNPGEYRRLTYVTRPEN